jgi:integrase
MSKSKFPKLVRVGHTTVKIYRSQCRGNDLYTVVHYLGKKRVRQNFADLGLATTSAETVANKLSEGEVKVLELKSEDRLAYVRAMEALKPTGVPLEMAVMYFAEAFKILEGASLIEAVRFFKKHHPSFMPKKTVPDVVKELLEAKEQDGVSDVYLKDLRGRLGRFEKKVPGQITLVTSAEIEDFLRGLKDKAGKALSGTSRNNYRRAVGTLVYFAESRGYLPKGIVEVESVAIAKTGHGDIEIFRPEELGRLLGKAKETTPELVPFIAIGAFAGLRHAEVQRLDWSEVRLDDGFIEVKASKAKTASRRLVPIPDNLKLWLADYRKADGGVSSYANMSKQLAWLAEAANEAWQKESPPGNFVWKHNALRHSFISYRLAEVQSAAQVALEAGNSPQMIFKHHRELVRPADAKAWFGIVPEKPANVMEMTKAA